MGSVSSDLERLEQDLALQRERLTKITELWRLQTAKLGFLRRQHEEAVDRLSDRLVAIYQSGNLTTVDVLLDSSNFSELVTRLDYAEELAAQDERIAESVGRAKDLITVQQASTTVTRKKIFTVAQAVAARTEQTRQVRNELVARESALSGTRAERREALASVQQQKEEYLHEVECARRGQRLAGVADPDVAVVLGSRALLERDDLARLGTGHQWVRLALGADARRDRHRGPDGHAGCGSRSRDASSTPAGWAATATSS